MQEIVNANPALRKRLYVTYAVAGFVIGSIQVGFAAAEASQPLWLTVALAVYAYAGVAFGFQAGGKVEAVPVSQVQVVPEVDATPPPPGYVPRYRANPAPSPDEMGG